MGKITIVIPIADMLAVETFYLIYVFLAVFAFLLTKIVAAGLKLNIP